MKFLAPSASDVLKTSAFVKIAGLVIVSLSLIFLLNSYYSSEYSPLTFFSNTLTPSSPSSPLPVTATAPSPSLDGMKKKKKKKKKKVFHPPPLPPVERMGIVDENGAMSVDFKVGEFNSSLVDELDDSVNEMENADKDEDSGGKRIKVEKFNKCDGSMTDYIPCLDNVEAIKGFNSSDRGEKYERHCPEQGKGLNCLVPLPKGYRIPIPWPKSRDEVAIFLA